MKQGLKYRGFTLIELLVVIAIIAMLLSILMPSLARSREQARRVVCMANLHSVGQSFYLYSHDFGDALVPGDAQIPWEIWSVPTENTECEKDREPRPVNLGHLLSAGKLPIPTGNNHVFFCPSGNNLTKGAPYDNFKSTWGHQGRVTTLITYMFNNSLDGFNDCVLSGQQTVLSHTDKINYVLGDGSSHVFNVKKLIYDVNVGPEGLTLI